MAKGLVVEKIGV
jgi:small subunit ribosomal protein S23e